MTLRATAAEAGLVARNLAVIAAGAGVWVSGTPWPYIAVGAVIAYLGLSSAVWVIRQAREEMLAPSIAAAQ